MIKKSDTPEKLEIMLGKTSHEVITVLAESIHAALKDAESGIDEYEAKRRHDPKTKIEKIITTSYIRAEKMVGAEFNDDDDTAETAGAVVALSAMAGRHRQTVIAEAAGAETNRVLNQAMKNPVILTQNARFRRFESPTRYYERTVSTGIAEVMSGTKTVETVTKRAVLELTRSGLRYVNYKSGWCNRTNVAVRRAMVTELTHATAEKAFENAEKMGVEYFEVEYHDDARPEHAEWQGKVYTEQELYDICGLGEVDGLCGANCRHYFYPFDPDKSERLYSDEFLQKKLAESKMTRPYEGKEYTPYDARQKMRQMEAAMRIQREKISILDKLSLEYKADKAKYIAQRRQYEKFAGAMNQRTDYRRVYQDGLGRV